jgi:hypothetical protein
MRSSKRRNSVPSAFISMENSAMMLIVLYTDYRRLCTDLVRTRLPAQRRLSMLQFLLIEMFSSIVINTMTLFFLIFLGWGEIESTWCIGH